MKKVKKLLALILMAAMLLAGCAASNGGQAAAVDAGQKQSDTENSKLKLVFTIDTEDKYGEIPNMIECDFGDNGNCGVDYIMDMFEERGMRAVFFVNIYEHLDYSGEYEGYMENLVRRIAERGHEVGLHAHKNSSLGFYNDELFDLSYEQQEKVIQYGIDFIKENTGKAPVSFRGGGYQVNDDTFKVLDKTGIKYDSSYYYDHTTNTFEKFDSLNLIGKASDQVENLVEFPVIRTIKRNGTLSKLDLNSMTFDEIVDVLEEMKARDDFPAAQIMFHSFSFMDQKEQPFVTPYFHEGTHMAYGVSSTLEERFINVLEYVKNDPDIEVVTFESYDELHLELPEGDAGDGIFACNSQQAELAAKEFSFEPGNKNFRAPRIDRYLTELPDIRWFVPQDVTISQKGSEVTFQNSYQPGLAEYAWYIKDCDAKKDIDKFMYTTDDTLIYTFNNSGHYQVKAFVRFDAENKNAKIVADVYVEGDNVKVVPANPS